MKRLTNFLFALVLTAAIASCVYDFGNNTGASGDVPNKSSNRITSLQAVINNAKEGDTINLSEHNITDFSATINKAVTINAANKNMNSGSLSIAASGVTLNGLSNVNVTASPSLGNGSLKISGSSLNSLNILGGGLNSIHLLNGTTITGKTIIGKEYNAAQNDQEPVRLVMDSTIIIADLTIKSSAVLDSGTSEVNDDNLKSVIFAIDETNAETSVNVAVSANLSFKQQTNWAKVQFQSSTAADASMSIYVMKKNETVTISKDFFTDAFQRLIGEVTKEEVEAEFSDYVDTPIAEPVSPISVDSLITPVTVTFCYNNGDATEDFTFAKGKKLDVSAQGKTKRGYVLLGWSTTSGAGEADSALTVGESVTVNEDETFYFVWKKENATTNIEYDGSFTKWAFSGNIVDISDKWDGSSTAPKFGILFMDSQTINEMMNLDDEILADGESTNQWLFNRPSGHSVYQLVRKNDNGIENLTFSTSQTGTYKTHYDGLISSINDGTKYAIYLDKDKIKKTDIWAFGEGYTTTYYDMSGDPVVKNEQQLTDDDALNLAGYIPIVLALSDNSHDQNYLTQFWLSSMIRMSPYKGELPTASDMPVLSYEGSVAGLEAWFASHNNPITDFYLTITGTVPDMTSDSAKTAFAACPSSFTLDLSKCTAFSSVNQNTTLRGNTKLTKVILPSSVTEIQGGFIECPLLTEVVIDNEFFKSENGIVFSNDSTNRSIVLYPSGLTETSYTISGVKTIGDNAFKGNNYLTELIISEDVTTIMGGAFASMGNLTSITIPASVTTINDNVFNNCDKLESIAVAGGNNFKSESGILFTYNGDTLIHYPAAKSDISYTIPSAVKVLAVDAFLNCKKLTSVTLPDNLETINRNAFSGCENLTSIKPASSTTGGTADLVLPNTVKDIRQNAFSGCSKLSSVILLSTNPPILDGGVFTGTALEHIYVPSAAFEDYKNANGWKDLAEGVIQTWENGGSGNGGGTTSSFDENNINYDTLLTYMSGDATYDSADGVSGLSDWFDDCNEESTYYVKLSDVNSENLTSLTAALKNHSLLKINLDLWQCSNLTSIEGYEAFMDCNCLVNVILPKTITTVTGDTFGYCCSLQNIYVDNANNNYCSINGVLYNESKTTLIKYPSGRTDNTYTIPETVTSIDRYAFYRAVSLTEMTIPGNVETLGFRAFSGTSLTTLNLNEGLIEIGGEAFYRIKIGSITIPTTVVTIESHAFEFGEFTSITIQSSNTELQDGALRYCYQLTDINLTGSATTTYTLDNGVLLRGSKLVCYPAAKTGTEYTIPNTITEIAGFAFSSCKNLTTITGLDNVESIGEYAFEDCSKITSLTIPKVQTISYGALFRCEQLSSISIGDSINSIKGEAFSGCSNLKTLTINNSNPPELAGDVFDDCTALEHIYVPNTTAVTNYSDATNWSAKSSIISVAP